MKRAILIAVLMIVGAEAQARTFDRGEAVDLRVWQRANSQKVEPEMVKWIGEISDASGHTSGHEHSMQFKNQVTGKVYDLTAPDLTKLHHDAEKNYLVEIEAEKRPKFLFWGGDLVVKKYRVIRDIASVPHEEVEESSTRPNVRKGGIGPRQ